MMEDHIDAGIVAMGNKRTPVLIVAESLNWPLREFATGRFVRIAPLGFGVKWYDQTGEPPFDNELRGSD